MVWAILFYGVTFNPYELSPKRFFQGLEDWAPTDEDREDEGFDEDEWWELCFQNEWEEAIESLLDKNNDPLSFGRMGYDEMVYYFAVRSTIHSSGSKFTFSEFEKDKWTKLLKEKCDKYGIPWSKPRFHVIVYRGD